MEKNDSEICAYSAKKRRVLTLRVKLDVITRHERGYGPKAISDALGLPRSTVSTILKDKEKILEHLDKAHPSMNNTIITKKRSSLISEVEKLLQVWIDEQSQLNEPLSKAVICEKALNLFNQLKEQQPEGAATETFIASNGWFQRFKVRANLTNINAQTEQICEDIVATGDFPNIPDVVVTDATNQAEDCKKRWRNMRDTYIKHRKSQMKRNRPPKWPLSQQLSFLDSVEHEKRFRTQSNYRDGDNEEPRIADVCTVIKEDFDSDIDGSEMSHSASTPFITCMTESSDNINDDARCPSNLRMSSEMRYNGMIEEDAIDAFFRSMALTVKTLPPHLQSEAKLKTLALISDLELRATAYNHVQ